MVARMATRPELEDLEEIQTLGLEAPAPTVNESKLDFKGARSGK